MKRLGIYLVFALCVFAVFGFLSKLGWLRPQEPVKRNAGDIQAVPVTAADIKIADIPLTLDAIGTVQPLNFVTIRTQVDGRLVKVAFTEGQTVKTGELLAIIDPSTYQAQYDQAVAKKAMDESQLANARTDLARYAKLSVDNSGSKQQFDTQKALVSQLEAQIRQDQGAIDNSKTVLDYATIHAPLSGRTGMRLVDPGNIVHVSDPNGIVTIAQMQPITIVFTIAQQFLGELNDALAKRKVSVDALAADNSAIVDHGEVTVVDNQVDQSTGTVKVKAVFPNPDMRLWPGQFTNVRANVSVLKNVIVAPTVSVQRGPNGSYVYILTEDGSVTQTSVTLGHQDDQYAVIKAGVKPPARVVTSGFTRLIDGAKTRLAQEQQSPPNSEPIHNQQEDGSNKNGEGVNQDKKK